MPSGDGVPNRSRQHDLSRCLGVWSTTWYEPVDRCLIVDISNLQVSILLASWIYLSDVYQHFKFIYTRHLFFQNDFLCNFTHHLCSQNTSNFSSRCQQVSTRRGGIFWNKLCNIMVNPNKSVQPIDIQQIHTVYISGFTIGIGSRRYNSIRRKIRESLLESAGVSRCARLSNWCTFWLANQQAGKYISATELEPNRFRYFPLGEIMCYLSTQLDDSDLAA